MHWKIGRQQLKVIENKQVSESAYSNKTSILAGNPINYYQIYKSNTNDVINFISQIILPPSLSLHNSISFIKFTVKREGNRPWPRGCMEQAKATAGLRLDWDE